MAIHVRCLKLNLPKLNSIITVATSKQTDTKHYDNCNRKCLQHSLIVKNTRGTQLVKPFKRNSALTKTSRAEKRICTRQVPVTSIYPITDNVRSLIPAPDNISSLIGCPITCYGRTLASIEHLIGCSHLIRKVDMTGDVIIIEDCRSELQAMLDQLYMEEEAVSESNNDVDRTSNAKMSAYNNIESEKNIILYSGLNKETDKKDLEPADDPRVKLLQTKDILEVDLNKYLNRGICRWDIYAKDVVLENNYWGQNKIHKGINSVILQILKYRIIVGAKFCHSKVQILRITAHPEDMTVKIRWRLITHGYINFLKMPIKNLQGVNMDNEGKWHDVFSTFYIQDDGKVYKVRVDRFMPSEEAQKVQSGSVAEKLVAALGVAPKPT